MRCGRWNWSSKGLRRRCAGWWTCRRVSTAFPVTLEVDAPLPRLGPRVEGLLYRAANEYLNNIRKHAAPRSVRMALRVEGHRVALTIVDDGRRV